MPIPLISGSTIVTVPTAPSTHVVTPPQTTSIITSPGRVGPPGAGVNLAGAVATYGDLPSGLDSGDVGAAYVVNANGKLYVWDGTAFPIEANGSEFKGDQGPEGRGIDSISLEGSDVLRFHMNDASNDDITVPAITAAAASASAAASSASAAGSSASAASGSATSASGSSTAASGSATAASGSATSAGTSATNAATSASTATTQATNASSSASSAATSASGAVSSASAASGSATASASSATASAGSATTAGTARDAAVTAQGAAETAEDNAAASASDASDSADAAAASAVEAADVVSTGLPSATDVVKGGILLPGGVAGELGGTYDHPSVTGWADKADLVSGKIPTSQIPAIALVTVQTAASTAARIALTAEVGDIAVQTGNPGRGTYMLQTAPASTDGNWTLLVSPTDAVTSVNGYTGIVVLAKADVGLASVDNTADTGKPVSTAQQTALNLKADNARTISAGTGLTGGGDLSANRTLAVSYGTAAGTAAQGNDSRITGAVPTSRTVTAGTGLTGGGDLSADRTLTVAYGSTSTTAVVGNDTRVVNAVQKDVNNNATINNLQEGYTTTATAAGTTTLTVGSTQIQMFTGTLAQNVKLPDVTTLVLGMDYVICNNSTGILTVQSSGSNTVLTVPAGARCTVTCVALTGTTAAAWFASPVVTFGTTAGTVTQGNDSRLSDTRTPSGGTVPCDFVFVAVSPGTTRIASTTDWTVGQYVGRAFTLTKAIYQFDTADASGSTVVQVNRNGSLVTSSNLTVTAANQADGTGTDAARTATFSQSFAVGDRILITPGTIGTTPGKGLRAWLFGTYN